MHPWVAILGLILLLTDGVTSYPRVTGMVGQSVRLSCTYGGEVTSMCWGRGACPLSRCGSDIIWTNGYSVTFQKDKRYKLNGNIGGGDVSLTIENAAQADSGLYCCRVEKRGWFNDIKITVDLSIKPAPPTTTIMTTTTPPMTTPTTTPPTTMSTTTTTPPTTTTTAPPPTTTTNTTPPTTMTTTTTTPPTTTTTAPPPTTTTNTTPPTMITTTTTPPTTTTTTPPPMTTTTALPTTMTVTTAPTTTRASTSALPVPAPTKNLQPVDSLSSPTQRAETQPTTWQETNITGSPSHSCSTDGYGTVTQSPDALWHNNQTPVTLAQDPWMSTNKGVYIGICVTALVLLLMFLVSMISKRYFCLGNKVELLRVIPLRDSHIGALKNAALKPVRAEDNIYIIDDLH
ncbi:hepatitis A virus cellular receptor 1 [Physeter macrocephalus]|uniref:Hepatitis A virus cellular receptor 1 n=1 Tax=Physeter macrocephalus TaxID=9755 RepID=A0A2Y9S9J8_PHYMC|nr:hepatitis A virus cellular receptor 1 [Physeter catodon]|eukprot:XP_023972970.1 hepatitis A virus cellular receptor 1 [Physeter catodon]